MPLVSPSNGRALAAPGSCPKAAGPVWSGQACAMRNWSHALGLPNEGVATAVIFFFILCAFFAVLSNLPARTAKPTRAVEHDQPKPKYKTQNQKLNQDRDKKFELKMKYKR